MQGAAHAQRAQAPLRGMRQPFFQLGGLLRARQSEQGLGLCLAHGPDHGHLRARGGVGQRQKRQHAVVAEPLQGRALMRPFGVQVRHQADVVIGPGFVLDAGRLAQPGRGAVGADEKLGLHPAARSSQHDALLAPTLAAVVQPFDAEHAHGLNQHPLDLARFDDPRQILLRGLPGMQIDAAIAVAVDFHGLHRRHARGRQHLPHAQFVEQALAGRGNGIDARMIDIGLRRRHLVARGQHRHALPLAGQGQCARQAYDARAADKYLRFHRADGSPACLGHSSHIWPRCFMRPACCPASSPVPQ